jgi:hypothetical protein
MDPYFLFTYCKALEVDSSRFSQPGDLFVALVFICSVIMVRSVFLAPTSLLSFPYTPTHISTPPISARPAKYIAEAVPEWRANYRCTVSWWSMTVVGLPIEKAVRRILGRNSGFGTLHLFTLMFLSCTVPFFQRATIAVLIDCSKSSSQASSLAEACSWVRSFLPSPICMCKMPPMA